MRRSPANLVVPRARPVVVPQGIRGGGLFAEDNREAQLGAMSALGTMFSIVNRTSTALAKVRWHLYKRAASGEERERVEVVDHDVLRLMRRPNPWAARTWMPFAEGTQQHVDLTGEGWWIVPRALGAGDRGNPVEMWHVRPDRMRPWIDENGEIQFEYRSAEGRLVDLPPACVVPLKMPNPLDPLRGMGPVPALLSTLGNTVAAIRWNESFFRNSAEPGGIIQLDSRLDDEEFEEMRDRWAEQHRGVGQAHRVAILERGQFVERKITQRDMEFVNGLNVNREMIREAFGMPKFLLGGDEGAINRATADAALVMMGMFLTEPRADRFRDALNSELLPMYGQYFADDFELDYDSPVPGDRAADNADLTARVSAAKTLLDAGADPAEVCEFLDLPAFEFTKPAAPVPPAVPPTPPPLPAEDAPDDDGAEGMTEPPENWARLLVNESSDAEQVDLGATAEAWAVALAKLTDKWQDVVDSQTEAVIEAARQALDEGDLSLLTTFGMPEDLLGAHTLETAMTGLATTAAGLVASEAAKQGQDVMPGQPDRGLLTGLAGVAAGLLAAQFVNRAATEALRLIRPGADPHDLLGLIRATVTATPAGSAVPVLSGLLSRAQNEGRRATMAAAGPARYYATERYDKNTCGPCKKIDGKELPTLDAALTAYGSGPYLYCEGKWRCRGTFIAVWSQGRS